MGDLQTIKIGTGNVRLIDTLKAKAGGWTRNWPWPVQEENMWCLIKNSLYNESENFGSFPKYFTMLLTNRYLVYLGKVLISTKFRVLSIKTSKSFTTLRLHFGMDVFNNKANFSTMQGTYLFFCDNSHPKYTSKFEDYQNPWRYLSLFHGYEHPCIRCTYHFRYQNVY